MSLEPKNAMDLNIAGSLDRVAEAYPDKTGLVCRKKGLYHQWSFRELQANSDRFAAALSAEGVQPGQRVMLMVPPSMEFVCLTFALFKLGAVVILVDPGMGYRNLLRCIGGVQPDVLVGIPKAQVFSRIFPRPFKTVSTRICVGPSLGFLGRSLSAICTKTGNIKIESAKAGRDDPAAIIFTTGSTGPPKGVRYTHGIFHAQLEIIRDYYRILPGEVDQPAFPLFALFSTALGAKAVIPEMDPARPANVDAEKFIQTLIDQQVTYSFGSPAIWNVVSRYCLARNIVLPVRKILMAGAPVPGELIERVRRIMPKDGEIHTPYGATECLPISSMTGTEILRETWQQTRQGLGTCVGLPLPGIDIQVIRTIEGPLKTWQEAEVLSPGEIGEIVVKGPVVTRAYDHNDAENIMAKIVDGETVRHRLGDMGYFDDQGRLWFCGRKAHRVLTEQGVMYTIPCEAIINEHPGVFRSALVGVGKPGSQVPVIIVELVPGAVQSEKLMNELCELAGRNVLTGSIKTFLVHPSFPVDIRHNAKIFREKLAGWAADQLNEDG
ncbi:MAG: fatty acid CoA ligase family protein [Desulfobulbaceae bacterium]|nr:fatty acid CoA ligase family protein [Desulfobulbaceae bacterium]